MSKHVKPDPVLGAFNTTAPARRTTSKKVAVVARTEQPIQEYLNLQQAFDYFNAELFNGKLPSVQITLQRRARMRGHFSPNKYSSREPGRPVTVHELTLNPDGFTDQTDEQILSVLLHEMVHLWQQIEGTPSRAGHNKEWAAKMVEVGLMPSSTGMPGGKMTGASINHYILPDGQYARAYTKLRTKGFKLMWQSTPRTEQAKRKRDSKTKFQCPEDKSIAWGKPELQDICGYCWGQNRTIVYRLPVTE